MRRWLLVFLVLLLPLQFSWAAVASYCQHESAAATSPTQQQHVGHHEHQHHGDATPVQAQPDKGAKAAPTDTDTGPDTLDLDCGTCHAGCCAPIAPTLTLVLATLPAETHGEPVFHLSSQPSSLPERPNWADLA